MLYEFEHTSIYQFEYYFEAIEDDMLDAELKTQIAGKTHIVTLVTHSDLDKTRSSCL